MEALRMKPWEGRPGRRLVVLGAFLLLGACEGSSSSDTLEKREQGLGRSGAVDTVKQRAPSRESAELLLLRVDGNMVSLKSRRLLEQELPQFPRRVGAAAWSFDALDASGAVVHQDNFSRPGFVRGEFPAPSSAPGSVPEFVQVELEGPHYLSLRVPPQAVSLRFFRGPLGQRQGPVLSELRLKESEEK